MEGNGRAIYEKGIRLGREEGLKEGKKETILSIFKQLVDDHYSVDQIGKILHLSEEDLTRYSNLLNL